MVPPQRLTSFLVFVIFTITLGGFQYGYHIGELNTPQSVISKCKTKANAQMEPSTAIFPPCLPMPDSQYALIVGMLTVGGIIGALSASAVSDKFGRRLSLCTAATCMALGSLIMTLAASPSVFMLGRFIIGLGGGMVTVVVPAYIAECVPESNRGFFGTLTQLAIVIGILVSQLIGMVWSELSLWRFILLGGFAAGAVQLVLLMFCVDSPRYMASQPGKLDDAKQALVRLRGPPVELAEQEILTWRHEQQDGDDNPKVNVLCFLTQANYRRPLCLVVLLQLGQQLSGINAVVFYSTSIMSVLFPQSSDRITVYISLMNLVMTVISANLMDRAGRRTLCLISMGTMALMSVLLGWSIQGDSHEGIAAFAIVGFVAAFAIGLGPIPFLMIPELVETSAAASAGSVALTVNMVSNFAVSSSFPVLRDAIGQDRVFYLFGLILFVLFASAWVVLPETKGRSPEEVVRSRWSIHANVPSYQAISTA